MIIGETQGQCHRTRASRYRTIPLGVQAQSRPILARRPSYVRSTITPPHAATYIPSDRTALAQPVPPMAVAKSILFLASEAWSGHTTGQILNVDCGKQGKVMRMRQEK